MGWVIALKDGRRAYLDYTLENTTSPAAEEIELEALGPGQQYPGLDSQAGSTTGISPISSMICLDYRDRIA
jgi:hypothetical protein